MTARREVLVRTEIAQLLRDALEAVNAQPSGELMLGWRLRLWSLMSRAYPLDSCFRRGVLSYVVATETLPAWEAAEMPTELRDVPYRLVRATYDLLIKNITPEVASQLHADLAQKVDLASGLLDEYGHGVGSAAAAYASLNCALRKDALLYSACNVEYEGEVSLLEQCWDAGQFHRLTDYLFDWESWETHRFASHVAAGVQITDGAFEIDANLLRQFWIRWLREKVPLVLGNPRDVAQQLTLF